MSHACTPILVGVTSPVSEILLLSRTAKFPFRGMDHIVHGHQKINRLELSQKIHANIVKANCVYIYIVLIVQPILT